jgi:hypothetical protein
MKRRRKLQLKPVRILTPSELTRVGGGQGLKPSAGTNLAGTNLAGTNLAGSNLGGSN